MLSPLRNVSIREIFFWENLIFVDLSYLRSLSIIHFFCRIALFTGLGGFIAQQLEEQLFRWLRAAELTCDRAALLVARDPKVDT